MPSVRDRRNKLRGRRRRTFLSSAVGMFDLSGGATFRVMRGDADDTVLISRLSTRAVSSDLERLGGDFRAAVEAVRPALAEQDAKVDR